LNVLFRTTIVLKTIFNKFQQKQILQAYETTTNPH
jgi:hypothetical protein